MYALMTDNAYFFFLLDEVVVFFFFEPEPHPAIQNTSFLPVFKLHMLSISYSSGLLSPFGSCSKTSRICVSLTLRVS